MIEALECVISAGPGVQVQWRETEDGCINISLRRNAGGIERLSVPPSSSWTHRINSRTITFKASLQNPDDSQAPIEDTDDYDQIHQKIARDWKSTVQMLDENSERWSEDAALFFSVSTFHSTEELSYRALGNSDKKLYRYQDPLHKINLSCFFDERFESAKRLHPEFLEVNCRRAVLDIIHPNYGSLKKEERNVVSKRFGRIVNQGRALRLLMKDNIGLLLTVGPALTAGE